MAYSFQNFEYPLFTTHTINVDGIQPYIVDSGQLKVKEPEFSLRVVCSMIQEELEESSVAQLVEC